MSIKKTLRIALIISSILPIIIVSVLAYYLIAHRLVMVKHDNLQQLAVTNSNGLRALIQTQQTEVNMLSIQEQLCNLAVQSQYSSSQKTIHYNVVRNNACSLLQQRQKLYPSCETITLYNIDQEVIASSDTTLIGEDYSDSITLSYINATGSVACGVSGLMEKVNADREITYTLEIGCPIVNNNKSIIGYIVSTIDISYFKDFLNSIEIGKTGMGLLLDKTGTIVYHPITTLIGTTISDAKLNRLVTNFYTGSISLNGTFENNERGIQTLYGYCVIPELDWVLLVKQDIPEIIALANIILYVLGWTILALFIVIIIISNFITKMYTSPIIELKDTMHIASNGNLEVQSNIVAKNEFGELSRSFNKMLHIIKGNYNELSTMRDQLVSNEEQLRTNYNHIEFLAYHDVLTNLPNKLAFIDRVNITLASSLGLNTIHAVYFVDLDNFKTINDTLGHDYGDNLLTQTAAQLLALTSTDDILARAGGDEFLLFREDIKDQNDAMGLAASIIENFKTPFSLNGELVYVSMSIGIALYPKNGTTTSSLIKNADIAMYKSKDTGKNKYTLFDSSMEAELNRNTLIIEVLRNAIQNKECFIEYQPQLNISENSIVGFEALMRINSNKLGFISPAEFIPIAEESGLIVELGEWILREACKFNKSLIDQGFCSYIVSVNISTVQINRSGFMTMLENVLEETKLPPENLELEITESVLLSSNVGVSTLLSNLQALGVRISLDDFGTGYSSLNYLTSIPINTLKIDKSFIDNIGKNDKDFHIADTIIQLAHSINITVIAEGVEYEEQLALLKRKKCDIIQGFLFSKPLLPSALRNLLDA